MSDARQRRRFRSLLSCPLLHAWPQTGASESVCLNVFQPPGYSRYDLCVQTVSCGCAASSRDRQQCTVKFKRFVASSICLCISCCRCDLFLDTACITEGPAWCVLYSVAFSLLPSVWSSADGQQLRHRSSTASYPTTDPTKALEIKQTVGFQVNESMLHSHCAFSTNAHQLLVA